jgi:ribonuclease HI
MSENYIAYCDGSYQPKINTGGWASIILKDKKIIKKLYYGLKDSTNNRMELMAVIETLKYFKDPVNITIYSDSQYVVNSVMLGWVYT